MSNKICSTCRGHVMSKDNFVQFDCPDCGKERIVRCKMCKDLSNKYGCPGCEFTGP